MRNENESTMDDADQGQIDHQTWKILDKEERKAAMEKYRKVFDNVKNLDINREEFTDAIGKLRENVIDQNECLQQIGVNELMTMDARFIAYSSELSFNLVKKFDTESKFDPKEFIRRLRFRVSQINRAKNNDQLRSTTTTAKIRFEQLNAFGRALASLQRQTPQMVRRFKPTLDDLAETRASQRTQRTRAKVPRTQVTQPTQFDSRNMRNDVDESEKRLRYIHRKLFQMTRENDNEVPVMQAAVHPESFCTTIENFFNIAFLARQAFVSIDMPTANDDDDDGGDDGSTEPVVRAFEMRKSNDGNLSKRPRFNDDDDDDNDDDIDEENSYDDDDEDGDQGGRRLSKSANLDESDDVESSSKAKISSILSLDHEIYKTLVQNLSISRPAWK